MLAYSMLTQIVLVPHQYFWNLFVMDQNQRTCLIVKKTQIQLVEMRTKTNGAQKLQLFIIDRTK